MSENGEQEIAIVDKKEVDSLDFVVANASEDRLTSRISKVADEEKYKEWMRFFEMECGGQNSTIRFTNEAEAKKLNANCKVYFEDSDEPVYINRELLAVYSNVFRVMFLGDFLEKNAEEVKLGVEREDFLSFLDCLYFPAMPVTAKNFKAVLILADRYDCPQLLEKCKELAEIEAKALSSVEDFKDFIEFADIFQWDHVMTTLVDLMKKERPSFFLELLDNEWMMALKKSTRQNLFDRMKNALPSSAEQVAVNRDPDLKAEKMTTRFTDEDEAKKLKANCKIFFEDSDEPVFINRELLAIYSRVFRIMFDNEYEEIVVEEVNLEAKREDFLSFLDCLYFPAAPVTRHNFYALIDIAKRYDCPQILKKCKEFAKIGARTMITLDDCKHYIEVAERFDWKQVMKEVISSMENEGIFFFMNILNDHWIEGRNKNTQRLLFAGMKKMLSKFIT